LQSPEQGAQTTVHLAVSESLEGVSGKYFLDCKVCIHWRALLSLRQLPGN